MASEDTYTDKQLFEQVSLGDELAFRNIFERFWPQVYGTSLHLLKKTEDARDLSQEIFIKLWENRARLSDISHPSSYLYTLSRNFVIDYLRKKVFSTENTDYLLNYFQCDQATPQENIEYKELNHLLDAAVDSLSGKVKEVFVLSRQKGLTHEQIAKELGLSTVTSKTYIVRALQLIRKYMETHAEPGVLLLIFTLLSKS